MSRFESRSRDRAPFGRRPSTLSALVCGLLLAVAAAGGRFVARGGETAIQRHDKQRTVRSDAYLAGGNLTEAAHKHHHPSPSPSFHLPHVNLSHIHLPSSLPFSHFRWTGSEVLAAVVVITVLVIWGRARRRRRKAGG